MLGTKTEMKICGLRYCAIKRFLAQFYFDRATRLTVDPVNPTTTVAGDTWGSR